MRGGIRTRDRPLPQKGRSIQNGTFGQGGMTPAPNSGASRCCRFPRAAREDVDTIGEAPSLSSAARARPLPETMTPAERLAPLACERRPRDTRPAPAVVPLPRCTRPSRGWTWTQSRSTARRFVRPLPGGPFQTPAAHRPSPRPLATGTRLRPRSPMRTMRLEGGTV